MLSSKGAINFNGEIVRKSRVNSSNKNSYYQYMSQNVDSQTFHCKQKTKTKSKSRKKKICSQEKKKNSKKAKSKEKGDNPTKQQKANDEKDNFSFGS